VIAHKIQRNSQQPGFNAAFAAETAALLVSPKKALLSERVRDIAIAHEQENHAVDSPLVLTHDFVEPLGGNLSHSLDYR
jgi:hypothetical protein